MMRNRLAFVFLSASFIAISFVAAAQQQTAVSSPSAMALPAAPATGAAAKPSAKSAAAATTKTPAIRVEPSIRIEGEKRFHANCSRCHMAPQKLPPRAAATIIRHMRVRATITDEDMRYILAYLAQ
jgi:mono/diheme cytochrome c family protein